MIVYTIIQILLTLAGAGVIGYSIYLTIQVSGDKLLTVIVMRRLIIGGSYMPGSRSFPCLSYGSYIF